MLIYPPMIGYWYRDKADPSWIQVSEVDAFGLITVDAWEGNDDDPAQWFYAGIEQWHNEIDHSISPQKEQPF